MPLFELLALNILFDLIFVLLIEADLDIFKFLIFIQYQVIYSFYAFNFVLPVAVSIIQIQTNIFKRIGRNQ